LLGLVGLVGLIKRSKNVLRRFTLLREELVEPFKIPKTKGNQEGPLFQELLRKKMWGRLKRFGNFYSGGKGRKLFLIWKPGFGDGFFERVTHN